MSQVAPLATPTVATRKANAFAPLAAGLMATLGLVPGLLGVPTIGFYLLFVGWNVASAPSVAIAGGALVGIALWILLGALFSWTADPSRVSAGIFRDLQARYLLIVGRLEAVGAAGAIAADRQRYWLQATSMRDELGPMFDPGNRSTVRTGSHWVSAAGYIAAWHRVHLAEEALMLLEPDDQVISAALYDRGRLQDSRIPGRDDLLKQSAAALVAIQPAVADLIGWKGPLPHVPAVQSQGRTPHTVLANLRKTINEYRDGLWEKLIYLRRRTIQALLFTGLTGYVVLSLALIEGAAPTAVVAGSAFYLAGATIGLFHAAYLEQTRRSAVEDYGLSTARLMMLPLVAGIAGVIGAGLTAVLGAPPLGLNLLTNPDLTHVFSLEKYPLGLVAAAIFGLTPGLLLERIRALGDDVKFDIATSEPTGSEKSDAATDNQ